MAYSYEHSPSNADAMPLYNDSIFKIWNWFDDVWGCSDWVTWHKSNVTKYGTAAANDKFLHHWDNLAMASSAIDCRTFNTAFRDYFKKVGLYDYLFSGIEKIMQPVGTAGDVLTNVTSGISGTSKTLKVIMPIVLIVIVVFVIIYVSKGMKAISKK